jgi:hypothetical protein
LLVQLQDPLKEWEQQRTEIVKIIFPQIAYLVSNIIVFISRDPPHHTGYFERLSKFIQSSVQNPGSGEKPFLVVIQNFCNPESQKSSTESYDLNNSKKDFQHCLRQQEKLSDLLQHYRDICFIRVPSWLSHPDLYGQQICVIKVC